MASDDNVVRLKHLQPFANGVSIPNGDNVLRLKHLVSLASAIADESTSKQPVLSLGSWSSADSIYSAEIFYDGDGTLSTDIGSISNGILTVEDDDGCFSGTITISTAAKFSGPIPALIDSFSIAPNEITIKSGASTTAEIQITTTPENAPYSLSIPDAQEWVSINNTTLVFSPANSVATGNYEVTVCAATNDDQKEATATVGVTKEKQSPGLYIKNPRPQTDIATYLGSNRAGLDGFSGQIVVTLLGGIADRTIKVTGNYPAYKNFKSVTGSTALENGDEVTLKLWNAYNTLGETKGTLSAQINVSVSGNDDYLPQKVSTVVKNCYEKPSINLTFKK